MTAFDSRTALLVATALSLGAGLSACTAAPRYPVLEGEAPGGGLEPLQARYPVTMPEPAPAPAPEPISRAPRRLAEDVAPRAAPSGEVGVSELSVPTAPPQTPVRERPRLLAQASPPASVLAPPVASEVPAVSPSAPPPSFVQRDSPSGAARFTIGAPVPPPPVVVAPTPAAPPVNYARPPASVGAPTYARPSPPASSPSVPPSAPAASATTSPPSPSGGPRPYTSLFPQGAGRPGRSAGIRSTPSNPGIAPRALTAPADEAAAAPPSTAEAATRGRGLFRWPLRGELISGFGDKGAGQRNDGLNIAANLGDAVRAAAAGEVVYAGDLVPGQGKLVLVKHAGGWVTAYAHLSRIEVKMRDPIAQGQEIGQAGQTGAVDRPQLHFEIRYAPSPEVKAAAVDPAALLPAS